MKCKRSQEGGLLVDCRPPGFNGLICDSLCACPNGFNGKLVQCGEDLGRDPIRDTSEVP